MTNKIKKLLVRRKKGVLTFQYLILALHYRFTQSKDVGNNCLKFSRFTRQRANESRSSQGGGHGSRHHVRLRKKFREQVSVRPRNARTDMYMYVCLCIFYVNIYVKDCFEKNVRFRSCKIDPIFTLKNNFFINRQCCRLMKSRTTVTTFKDFCRCAQIRAVDILYCSEGNQLFKTAITRGIGSGTFPWSFFWYCNTTVFAATLRVTTAAYTAWATESIVRETGRRWKLEKTTQLAATLWRLTVNAMGLCCLVTFTCRLILYGRILPFF